MWNFLRPDSKFMFYANKFCDLIALNLLVLVFSIPVITIGASSTAMHYVLLKIYRDELQGGVIRNFVSAFKSNFKQTSPVWLVFLVLGLAIGFDLLLFNRGLIPMPTVLKYVLIALSAMLYLNINWFFILQSRYSNPVKNTLRNAFLCCVFYPLGTLLIGLFSCAPLILILLLPQTTPIVLMCGFALAGILCTSLYSRIFIQYEAKN